MEPKNNEVFITLPKEGENAPDLIEQALKTEGIERLRFDNGTYHIDRTVEINCDVVLSGSACFVVEKGASFILNGNLTAGKRNIFSGEGDIRIQMTDSWGYVDWVFNTVKDNPVNRTKLIQKAFDSLNRILLTDENFKISDVSITHPLHVKGIGARLVPLIALTGAEKLITIASSGVTLENLTLKMTDTAENGVALFFATDQDDITDFSAKNLYIDGAFCSITDADGDHTVKNARFDAVTMNTTRGTQLLMHDFASDITFIDVSVLRRHAGVGSCNTTAAVIENADRITMEHFDVNGDWADSGVDGHGLIMRNCHNVKMRRCLMEYLCGSGFIFENCSGFTLKNVQVYSFKNTGFVIDGLSDSKLEIVKVTNPGSESDCSKEGNYIVRNCSNVTFDSVISNFAYGTALLLTGNENVTVNGFINADIRETQSEYVVVDGGNNKNVVIKNFIDLSASANRKDKSFLLKEGVDIVLPIRPKGTVAE